MSHRLDALYAPRSVAVVGAGERATSSGGAVLQMLRRSGYRGEVLPINPKGGTAFGLAMQPSLAALKAPADLCVIVIRPDLILDSVKEAAATGHKTILVLPGGFAEAGEEGRKRDAELRALAQLHGLIVAGPNCAGLISLGRDARLGATFLRDLPPGGGLALVSQSGALAEEVINAANQRGLPFGTVVTVGNAMQLGMTEHLDYLGQNTDVSAVFLYVESIDDPVAFRAVARRVAAHKPVVMLMGGQTPEGAAAATAHTGAVANDDASMAAFARECGVVRVKSLRHLLLAAQGFGRYPGGLGRRALILSNSGGPGVLATDAALLAGLTLPTLPDAMRAALRAAVPPEASIANPLDLLADAREDRFGLTLEQVKQNAAGAYDMVLGIHVVPFMVDPLPVVSRIAELAPRLGMPMLHSMMGTLPERAGLAATLASGGVPLFADIEEMAECAGLLAQYPPLRAAAAGPLPDAKPALRARG